MTICPGKTGASYFGAAWARDLPKDLESVVRWDPAAVVTLMPGHELEALGVSGLGRDIAAAGIEWHHLPIDDLDVPDAIFERLWTYSGHRLRDHLIAGRRVLIHCRGGLGRSGLVAARLLAELGAETDDAIRAVRAARPGAIETALQESFVKHLRPMATDHQWCGRVLGSILAGSLGDAWGYAIEFDSLQTIKDRFGPAGLSAPHPATGPLVVSDDTQMTLFTAEGLVEALEGDEALCPTTIVEQIRLAYLRWLNTQLGPIEQSASGIQRYAALQHQRAPGNTCLSALRAGGRGSPEVPINDSKGCGGVMRVAPLGLLAGIASDDAFLLGRLAASLTHGHSAGFESAAALSSIVRELTGGTEITDAIASTIKRLTDAALDRETVAGLRAAVELANTPSVQADAAIRQLGLGWVGEEALAIAIYAVLVGTDFTEVIAIAANHDGDSDSTASIAGQIWGAAHGLAGIPHAWIARLDVLEPLCEVAGRLLHVNSRLSARCSQQSRLRAVALHVAPLCHPDFKAGRWITPRTSPGEPIQLGYPELSEASEAFLATTDQVGWLKPFDWPTWSQTPRGRALLTDNDAIAEAGEEDLARVVMAYVRKDRFCTGELLGAFEAGLMAEIARRAAALAAQIENAQQTTNGA